MCVRERGRGIASERESARVRERERARERKREGRGGAEKEDSGTRPRLVPVCSTVCTWHVLHVYKNAIPNYIYICDSKDRSHGLPIGLVQGYLAHKKQPPPLGPP